VLLVEQLRMGPLMRTDQNPWSLEPIAGMVDAREDIENYTGGLIDEAEDLRLHVMSFGEAMALIDSGEINIGVLIMMLYWLARERDRLRKLA